MSVDRPIPPTKRRLERARRDGNTLKSQLFIRIFQIAGAALLMSLTVKIVLVKMALLIKYSLYGADLDPANYLRNLLWLGAATLGGVLLPAVLAGNFFAWMTGGFCISSELAKARMSRIDPQKGLRQFGQEIKRGWEVALKLGFMAYVSAHLSWLSLSASARGKQIADLTPALQLQRFFSEFVFPITGALLFVGLFDLFLRYRERRRDLYMTVRELKDEMREEEGCTQHKATRRMLHIECSQSDFVSAVRRCKVIVVEPAN